MEIGFAGHLPGREVGLKAIREMVKEPSPGQQHILAGQKEASGAVEPWAGNTISLHHAGHVLRTHLPASFSSSKV